MKKAGLLFIVVAVCFNTHAQTDEATLAYINQYKQIAVNEMIRTGGPAAITLAQGILESNSGRCPLVQQSNNHFGIKCKSDWTGDVVYHDDDRKGECFRRYNTAEDSYRDHSDFLKNRPNYTFLFDIDATDYTDWAYGLKSAGYATNPSYAQSIITTIEKYDLEQYTDVALQQNNEITVAAAPVKLQDEYAFEQPAKINDAKAAGKVSDQQNDKVINYPDGVFQINQTNVLYAKAGSSLFAIASKFAIPYKKLLSYNDLSNVDILDHSTLIYLEKKPKRGSRDYHVALPDEDMHDIAQEEGVQLESLLAYNNLQKNNQPKAGDKILLHGESRKLF